MKSKNTAAASIPDSIISSPSFVAVKSACIVDSMQDLVLSTKKFRGTVYWVGSFRTTTIGLIGGIEWLKQLKKKLFSMVAFSLSEVAFHQHDECRYCTLASIQIFNCFPQVFGASQLEIVQVISLASAQLHS